MGVGNYTSLADVEAACDAAAGCEGFTYEGTGEPSATKPVRVKVGEGEGQGESERQGEG